MRRSEAQAAMRQAKLELDSLWSRASAYGMAAEDINAEVESILRRMNRNGSAPQWAIEFVRGYWSARRALWFDGRNGGVLAEIDLEHVLVAPDGKRFGTMRGTDFPPFPDSVYGSRPEPGDYWHGWQHWPRETVWRKAADAMPARFGNVFMRHPATSKES